MKNNPLTIELTTTTSDEEVLENVVLKEYLPVLEDYPVLACKLTLVFNGNNKVSINNEKYQSLLMNTVWDSDGVKLSINSLKIKNPCTFTMIINQE